jgi:hypothetical protein
MKNLLNLIVLLLLLLTISNELFAQVKVKGYYKKDGTYVQPHYRSNPDGNPYNNWSYPGNTNPYTGKTATGDPDTYLKNYYNNSSSSNYNNNSYTGSNTNSTNYNYNSSSYYSSSYFRTGNLLIFTNCEYGGNVYVFVDGNYKGTLDKYYKLGSPEDFGEDGTVSLEISKGYHTVQAIDESGSYWSGSVYVYSNTDNLLKLEK